MLCWLLCLSASTCVYRLWHCFKIVRVAPSLSGTSHSPSILMPGFKFRTILNMECYTLFTPQYLFYLEHTYCRINNVFPEVHTHTN